MQKIGGQLGHLCTTGATILGRLSLDGPRHYLGQKSSDIALNQDRAKSEAELGKPGFDPEASGCGSAKARPA